MNFEESLMMALEHPAVMLKENKDADGKLIASTELYDFEKWTSYLHDDNDAVKEEREKRIKADKVYEFCRLQLDTDEILFLNEYLKADSDVSDLSGLAAFTIEPKNGAELKAKIDQQFKLKRDYLKIIMMNLPIIKDIIAEKEAGFNVILNSHIDAYIAEALVFDQKRFNFSNLHKALESIKGAVEVPRKAKHAAEAAIEALKDSDKFDIVEKSGFDLDNIKIKREKKDDKNAKKEEEKKPVKTHDQILEEKKAEEAKKVKREREINLIDIALKGADKSTSSPKILFPTVGAGLLLAVALLIHNAVTTKAETEEEAEDDEECGTH